jgi:hypothetical protein
VAVAAVVLLCQATAWVHAAAIPHVTCLEHGESVHLPATKALRPLSEASAGLAITAASELEAHAHDHCSLQGQRTTSAAAPVQSASAPTLAPAPPPAVADARPAVRLLRFAPKTSPPRSPSA